MSEYAPDEPASFDAIIERQPFEPVKESADPFSGGREGIQEAADEVSRGRETRETFRRFVRDPDNPATPAPADVTISAETAADALRENRNLEAQFERDALDEEIAREIDRIRADQPQVEQPPSAINDEARAAMPQAPDVQPEYATEPDELDRLLNSVPDENTRRHIKQGLIQEYSRQQAEIAQARQAAVAHANAAAAALEQRTVETLLVAEQAALAPFPELANVRREDMQVVLNHIRQTNPQRFEEIDRHVARVKGLAANQLQTAQLLQQQQIQAQHQQAQAQEQQRAYDAERFRQYAEQHDRQTLVNETPETRKAIESALIEDAGREGIDREQLIQIWNSNPVARHSFFQNLIADGMKYRLAQRNIPRAAVRPVAQVQRPGVSEPAADRSAYADLERQFRGQPLTAKQAAALVTARRSR